MAASANPNDVIQLPRLRPGDLGTLMLELSSTCRGIASALTHAAKAKTRSADLAALPDQIDFRALGSSARDIDIEGDLGIVPKLIVRDHNRHRS